MISPMITIFSISSSIASVTAFLVRFHFSRSKPLKAMIIGV
jgi:hypothetical protein